MNVGSNLSTSTKLYMKRPLCEECDATAYSEKYDSYYCPMCYKWLEPYCQCTKEAKDAGECHTPSTRPEINRDAKMAREKMELLPEGKG